MNTKLLRWVVIGYFTMFLVLGLLSLAVSLGSPIPPPNKVQSVLGAIPSEDDRRQLIEAWAAQNARFGKLSDIALSSFQIVIGAIIGLFSALGSIALGRAPDPAALQPVAGPVAPPATPQDSPASGAARN